MKLFPETFTEFWSRFGKMFHKEYEHLTNNYEENDIIVPDLDESEKAVKRFYNQFFGVYTRMDFPIVIYRVLNLQDKGVTNLEKLTRSDPELFKDVMGFGICWSLNSLYAKWFANDNSPGSFLFEAEVQNNQIDWMHTLFMSVLIAALYSHSKDEFTDAEPEVKLNHGTTIKLIRATSLHDGESIDLDITVRV